MPFFPQGNLEELRVNIREPYIKFEEKKPEQWYDMIKFVSEFTTINILQKASAAKWVDPSVILTHQFTGVGQIVEFEHSSGDRICQIGVCSCTDGQWVLIFHSDLDSSVPVKK